MAKNLHVEVSLVNQVQLLGVWLREDSLRRLLSNQVFSLRVLFVLRQFATACSVAVELSGLVLSLLQVTQLLLRILLVDFSRAILLGVLMVNMLLRRFFNWIDVYFHVLSQILLLLLLFFLHVSFSGARLRHLHWVAADAQTAQLLVIVLLLNDLYWHLSLEAVVGLIVLVLLINASTTHELVI